jgi:hypothetical protein
MKTFANVLSLTIVIVAVTFALVPQHVRADPPPGQVTVINAAGQPVPVSGSVAAAQSGSWFVGINGTPSVTIANTTSAPIPTQSVDEYGRQPFQQQLSMNIADGSNEAEQFVTIPSGKRLVVEHVSAILYMPTGQVPDVRLGGTTQGMFAVVFATAEKMGAFDVVNDQWTVARQALLYADPGPNLLVVFRRNIVTGNAPGAITISGHLINP